MLVASQGARVATRKVSSFIPHTAHDAASSSRAIHIPSYVRSHPRIPTPGTAQKLFAQSRNLLGKFFAQLTAPGLRAPTPSFARSLHGSGFSRATIQQGFSFPVRTTLSRPVNYPFLPRAPQVAPRSMTQIGLGTARNFSSGRPLFQNLVENVPVAGRAFYEADWEVKMRKEREMMRKPQKTHRREKASSKEMLKPQVKKMKAPVAATQSVVDEAEFENYFAAPTQSNTTTCLFIPLAPTPTSRVPLPQFTATDPSLLPLAHLTSLHYSHEVHSLRVSDLFSRLDKAKVWERGVSCSAYSHGASLEGVCTVLKVEFEGWTKAEVRGIIGESGTGWCVLEEKATEKDNYDDDSLSDTSSIFSGISGEFGDGNFSMKSSMGATDSALNIDPAQSFVLPTLDLTSSFVDQSSSSPFPPLPRSLSGASEYDIFSTSGSDMDFDPWLDTETSSVAPAAVDEAGVWVVPSLNSTINGGFGFSSQFARTAEITA